MDWNWSLHIGDCREKLRAYPDDYFDALLSDPPYGLKFMGRRWDYDVPSTSFWLEAFRVLRPGGSILVFGGTRMHHRLVCNIEDAGFEIRDMIAWVYGSGFPKSLDISKAIEAHLELGGSSASQLRQRDGREPGVVGTNMHGHRSASNDVDDAREAVQVTRPEALLFDGYGTALKPAMEPICVAMKPLDGTYAENAIAHGVAGINIDGARIGTNGGTTKGDHPRQSSKTAYGDGLNGACEVVQLYEGRWPANLILDELAAEAMDAQSGNRQGGRPVPANTNSWGNAERQAFEGYNDEGGASRFFYVAKPTSWERNFGCEHLPLRSAGEVTDRQDGSDGLHSPRAGAGRTSGSRNFHPTIKPITLAQHLATLLLPPQMGRHRRLLVPFSGSGSEMIGALRAGWDTVTGIEMDPEYIEIAMARLRRWSQVPVDTPISELEKPVAADPRQGSLF